MDSILHIDASSSSSLPSPPCTTTPSTDAVKQHQLEAQQFAAQRRSSFRCTREEDAFVFREYVAKRRRRTPHQDRSVTSTAAAKSTASDSNRMLPLFESKEEIADVTTDSRWMKPLRRQNRQQFAGHNRAVNELQWNPVQPFVFLSASMDATVRLWQSSADEHGKCRRKLLQHSLGVKSAKWSLDGRQILSGGYDGMACCIDAETGQMQHEVRRPSVGTISSSIERITTVHFHPMELNSILLGTDKGRIYCHDLRTKAAVTTYEKSFGDVHDLLFLSDDGQRFVSSAGIKQRNASNQTLLVWDWRSATLLYDRLDSNMLAHSCLRKHPTRPCFVAQCSGKSYATLYSSRAPYKCLKGPSVGGHRPPLRFEGGHEVGGYGVQGSFSHDGRLWASGDANGRVVLYRALGKRELVESFQLYSRNIACVCAEFRPSYKERPNSKPELLIGSSDGSIDLFQ